MKWGIRKNRTTEINSFRLKKIKSTINKVIYENFSKKELNELKIEWKTSFNSICDSFKSI